jgi:NitT/TauT family transport system ATP-binding protein
VSGVGVEFKSVCFAYPVGGPKIFSDFCLDVPPSQVLGIFGPNGCGKSTILAMIGQILKPDAGRIHIDVPTGETLRIGFVFQNYNISLFPWRNCLDNIIFSIERHHTYEKATRIVQDALTEYDVLLPLSRYPNAMSGGQKQLTAIMRAVVLLPNLLVMDEPFGSLDFLARARIIEAIESACHKLRTTAIVVSHELDELLLLSDRILVFSNAPIRILGDFNVTASRPRSGLTRACVDIELKRKILKSIPAVRVM